MASTAADVLVDALIDWDVDTVFGIPGDGVNGIVESLRQRQDKIRFVQVRHEESAAFMACGYAKWTGKLGVCLATSGPGGIHLLNGLYDAKLDGQPVLAITGLQFHDLISTSTQQDVELDKLFMDACVYDTRIMGAAHVENVVNLACHTAIAKSGVAHVTMPVDIQSLPTKKDARSARNVPHHTSRAAAKIIAPPRAQDLRAAADILNAGTKICILAGRGALGARRELRELAARLKAPVAKALLGKGAMADTDPLCTGGVGLLGTKPSQDALTSCDTLLIVGSSFPYIEFYPKPDQARAVQIDTDPARIGLRYPVACGIVADAADALASLLPLVDERRETGFLDTAQGAMKAWRDSLAEQGQSRDQPMKPQVVAYELNRVLPDNAIVATDSGTNTTWCARYLDMRDDMMFSVSGNLASRLADCPMRMPPRSHSPIARWWPLSATAASAC